MSFEEHLFGFVVITHILLPATHIRSFEINNWSEQPYKETRCVDNWMKSNEIY